MRWTRKKPHDRREIRRLLRFLFSLLSPLAFVTSSGDNDDEDEDDDADDDDNEDDDDIDDGDGVDDDEYSDRWERNIAPVLVLVVIAAFGICNICNHFYQVKEIMMMITKIVMLMTMIMTLKLRNMVKKEY